MSAAGVLGWAIEALIASSLLMAFVLLVRKEAQRALGPQLAYWLWALPALRMALPPLPAAWRESASAPISAASETVLVLVQPILPAAAPGAAPFPWAPAIGAAWALGALGFFAWHGFAHASYVRRIISPPARHRRLPGGAILVESDEAAGPVAFGVLKRFVAVPGNFAERYDADERRLALAHELGHHARGDLIANWIALAMLAAHWFNPLAWIAYRKFRADQEMANDARVLAALRPIERHLYGCAIVKAAQARTVSNACHLHTIEDLKRRLRMLKAGRKPRRVLVAGAAGIAGLTVAGLGVTASGAAAEKIHEVAATQVEALAKAPPAPPAPAAPAPIKVERKKVVIVRDGKTQTYEGADADAYVAAHPDMAPPERGRETRRHRIVINDNGHTRIYEGGDADAYLKAHPDFPPPPPSASWGPSGMPPAAARAIARADAASLSAVRAARDIPEVRSANCGDGGRGAAATVVSTTSEGRRSIVICADRIERETRRGVEVAVNSAQIQRAAMHQALEGMRQARASMAHDRRIIEQARREALAAMDDSIAEMEQEIADIE